jgi:spore coat polysaccharide biosynthesis protein SpsF
MIIICVAVRMKSTRCPEKALADLYGRPLILRLVDRLAQSEYADDLVLCTSKHEQDDILEIIAKSEDISYCRGGELDVASRFLSTAEYYGATHIVRVTGDNPLTDPDLMDAMIEKHLETNANYTFCTDAPMGTKSEIIKVTALHELYDREDIDLEDSEYMTYHLHELSDKHHFKTGIDRPEVRLTVDTPEDLAKVQAIYEDYKGKPPLIEELIEWHDKVH